MGGKVWVRLSGDVLAIGEGAHQSPLRSGTLIPP